MSGHSRWSKVKHYKGIIDSKRGKIFAKLGKEMSVAAKHGGGDPGFNPRLRTILMKARADNMPVDNIERAIKKGTGELEGASYEEVSYEGYGPGGAAVIIEATTDNSTRTVAEVRHAFNRNGGNLGATNSVAWMFDRKGQVYLDASRYEEDSTLEAALESGAEDFVQDGEQFVITTTVPTFHAVQDALRERGFEVDSAEIAMVPKTTVKIEGRQAEQMIRLVEALEELVDVSKVFSNFDIEASQLAEASS